MTERSLRRGVLGGLLLAIPLLAVACGLGSANRLEVLQQLPESELYYPGAEVTRDFSLEAEFTIDGQQSAQFGHQLGSQGTAEDILEFYERELEAAGWTETTTHTIPSQRETSVRGWRRDDIVFRLSIRKTTGVFAVPAELLEKYETVYEFRLIDDSN